MPIIGGLRRAKTLGRFSTVSVAVSISAGQKCIEKQGFEKGDDKKPFAKLGPNCPRRVELSTSLINLILG